jgi:choline dehydrogenase/5-(hydroxymethyl)furfural/furfural oxidase
VSAAGAYLEPALDRSNLSVVPDTPVDRVVLDGRRALGVVTARGDHVEADRVVLCAGAIETPAILLRSGVDTPGIGQGLADHVGFTVSFELLERAPIEIPAIGLTVERPGRQIVVMDRLPDASDRGALIAGLLAVAGTGRVSLPDPAGPPLVELAQLSGFADLDGLEFVAREALDLLDVPDLREVAGAAYVDDHGTPADRLRDPAALRAWIPEHLGGYHHLAGSCRLGVCLGQDGDVIGHERLFVADAAALAGPPLRNPYVAVVRHAERFAARHAVPGA